jgi:pimeloyl-ACP methyl ester carboxylesterase
MTISTYSVPPATLTVDGVGAGRPFLLLHGGAGPVSFLPFAARLAADRPARVLTPTHPGWNGTPRPAEVGTVRDLARIYVGLLEHLDLTGVTVVGNSIGGWIAAEIALLASPRVAGVVIMNGVGLDVPGHPVADFFSLSLDELTNLSYADPDRFRPDPTTFSDAQRAAMAGNREAIALYAGREMVDPTLATRLSTVDVPTTVLWGQADRVVDPAYGLAYAAAIPTASHVPLEHTGHLPQIESPERTIEALWEFADKL